MKTITIFDIPESKYDTIMEFLKQLKVPVVENQKAEYVISDDHKQFLEESLQHYLKNPNDVEDFDKAIDDIENGL